MKLIQYSDIEYGLTISNLYKEIESIRDNIGEPETGVTNVQGMEQYVELLDALSILLKEYKELLELDQKALVKVGMEMKLQDLTLKNLFR